MKWIKTFWIAIIIKSNHKKIIIEWARFHLWFLPYTGHENFAWKRGPFSILPKVRVNNDVFFMMMHRLVVRKANNSQTVITDRYISVQIQNALRNMYDLNHHPGITAVNSRNNILSKALASLFHWLHITITQISIEFTPYLYSNLEHDRVYRFQKMVSVEDIS